MANKRLKVRRESVVACMTCPICSKLLVEATTISLCLHSFCRTCIYKKLSDDEFDTCPVCDINLGCNPVDKLRPDHTLQYMLAKIFPVNKGKADAAEAPEAMPSVSPPAKRKERSLSSLVVSMPKVSVHNSATGKRTRGGTRRSSFPRGSSPSIEEHAEEDLVEDHLEKPSCSENLNKISQNINPDQISDEHVDLLNCLAEAANGTNFSKSTSQGPAHVKAESSTAKDSVLSSVEEYGHKAKIRYDKNDIQSARVPTKCKKCPPKQNTPTSTGMSPNSMQVVVRHHHARQNVPIWFSLVASEDQEGASRLPQISSGFLRMKDSGIPVSAIRKYIVKKLELSSEEEVQIMSQGHPVDPTLKLRNLLDQWLQAAPATKRVKTRVGNTAKEYVMVLKYSRKTPAQTPVSGDDLSVNHPNATAVT